MINRISRELMLMEMAHIAAKRGTCGRLAVGAIIARDSRPISMGYAGVAAGAPHCSSEHCGDLSQPCRRTIHAEDNALKFAKDYGVDVKGAAIYITDSPCLVCAELIEHAMLGRVYFNRPYRNPAGVDFLKAQGIPVFQIVMNGFIRRV